MRKDKYILGVICLLFALLLCLTFLNLTARMELQARVEVLEKAQAETDGMLEKLAEGWEEAYQTLDQRVDELYEKFWISQDGPNED